MYQLNLEECYPEYLQLKTKNFSWFLSCPIMIKNILDKKVELIDQWGMLNVLSITESQQELLSRLDDKIDEEMLEIEAEINLLEWDNNHNLEWEIADVLEVTQAIKNIARSLVNLTSDQERTLDAAINTRKYIVGVIDEYNLQIRDIIKAKKLKYKKKGWFNKWYIWWGVTYDELETQEWINKLWKLLRH